MAKKTNKDLNKNLSETLKEVDMIKPTNKTKKTVAKKVEKVVSDMLEVKFKKIDEFANIPTYAHDGDIGMDMTATSIEYNHDYDYFEYGTGLSAEAERGKAMLLLPRSSVSNTEAFLCNTPGLVDPFTYRGEIKFRYKNRTSIDTVIFKCAVRAWNALNWWEKWNYSFKELEEKIRKNVMDNILSFAPYEIGERIGQMVMVDTPTVSVKVVDELSETVRGEGGFGSSGK